MGQGKRQKKKTVERRAAMCHLARCRIFWYISPPCGGEVWRSSVCRVNWYLLLLLLVPLSETRYCTHAQSPPANNRGSALALERGQASFSKKSHGNGKRLPNALDISAKKGAPHGAEPKERLKVRFHPVTARYKFCCFAASIRHCWELHDIVEWRIMNKRMRWLLWLWTCRPDVYRKIGLSSSSIRISPQTFCACAAIGGWSKTTYYRI